MTSHGFFEHDLFANLKTCDNVRGRELVADETEEHIDAFVLGYLTGSIVGFGIRISPHIARQSFPTGRTSPPCYRVAEVTERWESVSPGLPRQDRRCPA